MRFFLVAIFICVTFANVRVLGEEAVKQSKSLIKYQTYK